jgi:hypothetical protein
LLAHLVRSVAGVVSEVGLVEVAEDEAVVGAVLLHLAVAVWSEFALAEVPNHLQVIFCKKKQLQ